MTKLVAVTLTDINESSSNVIYVEVFVFLKYFFSLSFFAWCITYVEGCIIINIIVGLLSKQLCKRGRIKFRSNVWANDFCDHVSNVIYRWYMSPKRLWKSYIQLLFLTSKKVQFILQNLFDTNEPVTLCKKGSL